MVADKLDKLDRLAFFRFAKLEHTHEIDTRNRHTNRRDAQKAIDFLHYCVFILLLRFFFHRSTGSLLTAKSKQKAIRFSLGLLAARPRSIRSVGWLEPEISGNYSANCSVN